MTLHRTRLASIERDSSPIFGPDAVALVDVLTLESWTEARRTMPVYSRAGIPVRFVRGRLT